MHAANAQRIEKGVGYAAAASFAAAVGFAAFHATDRVAAIPGMVALSGVAATVAYPVARLLLRLLEGHPKPFLHFNFDVVQIEPLELDELVLTDNDRVEAEDPPLELNDILLEIAPNSRVVQLFDPSTMPAPEQLEDRADRHVRGGTSHSAPPDASDALFEALADLRRSLR